MLIECLIEREGYTTVSVQRSKYEFKRNNENRQVCDVLSGSHAEYLLKLNDFVVYQPAIPEPIVIAEPKQTENQEIEKPKVVVKMYACKKCGKEFKHQSNFSTHKRKCK